MDLLQQQNQVRQYLSRPRWNTQVQLPVAPTTTGRMMITTRRSSLTAMEERKLKHLFEPSRFNTKLPQRFDALYSERIVRVRGVRSGLFYRSEDNGLWRHYDWDEFTVMAIAAIGHSIAETYECVPIKSHILFHMTSNYTKAIRNYAKLKCQEVPNVDQFDSDTAEFFCFENKIVALTEAANDRIAEWAMRTTLYAYVEPTGEEVQTVLTIVTQVFPNPVIRQFFMDLASNALLGTVKRLFLILLGSGKNGKSLLLDLFREAFGGFGINLSDSAFTRSSSSSASPEISALSYKRFATCTEFNHTKRMSCVAIKQICGSTDTVARALFKNETSVRVCATTMVAMNHAPKFVDSMDQATYGRVRFLDCESTFVESPQTPNEEKHIYAVKEEFKTKAFQLAHRNAVIQVLLEHRLQRADAPDYCAVPPAVERRSIELLQQQCPVAKAFFLNFEYTEASTPLDLSNEVVPIILDHFIDIKVRKMDVEEVIQTLMEHPFIEKYVTSSTNEDGTIKMILSNYKLKNTWLVQAVLNE